MWRVDRARGYRDQVSQRHVLARLYKLAALKVGVPDYKELVTRRCIRRRNSIAHGRPVQPERAFFMELTVVIILVVELFYMFKGATF